MAPTALLSPRPQQTDAPTPRQVRLRAVTYYYCLRAGFALDWFFAFDTDIAVVASIIVYYAL
jgi:hypothetical protein